MPFTPSISWRNCYFLIFLLSLAACSEGIFESGIDEGVIEYKIEYPSISGDDVMMDLLPKKMETTFKDGEFRNEIIAGMGLFKTSIIRQGKSDKLIHTIKVLNKKQASEVGSDDIAKLNHEFNEIDFEATDGEKTIAGYKCKEMIAKVKGDSAWEFKLYYTDEIKIPNANYMNPFDKVEGVLMQYEMINHDIHMQFTAEKVLKKEVADEDIHLASDYKMISPAKLSEELDAIFEKVK